MDIQKEGLKKEANEIDPTLAPEAKQEDAKQLAEKIAKLEAEKVALAAEKEALEQDRNNYRQGLLAEKSKKIDLFHSDEVPTPAKETKIDEYGNPVEVEDTITPAVEKILAKREGQQSKQNQTIALKKWMSANPELVDDALRGSVLDEFVSRSGKSVEGILEDLNRSYGYYKFSKGIIETKKPDAMAKPAFNPGSSNPSEVQGGYTEAQKQLMASQNITPEKFEEIKKRILEGSLNLPSDTVKVILNKDYII